MRNMGSAARLGMICLAAWIAGIGRPAQAQLGIGRGPTLPAEKQDGAWTTEAKSVGLDLKLTDEQTAKMTEAYKAARKSFQEASQKIAEESQGDRMAMFQGILDLQTKEAEKLEGVLKGTLDEAQTKGAMASLGSFNPMWDVFVDTLNGFKLDGEKQAAALKQVKIFIEGASKLQSDAMASMDIQTLREELPKLKQKLDEDLTPILAAEQLAEWKTKTATRRRGQGGTGAGQGDAPGTAAPQPPPSDSPKTEK